MRARIIALAAALSLPLFSAAEPPATAAVPHAVQAQKAVEAIFRSALTPDQAAALKPDSTLPQIAAVLLPEQKGAVRSGLSDAERSANSVDDLREIARGYRLLGGSPVDIARVARRMQELDPKNSEGFSLTADALSQSGDAKGAVAAAKKALKLNPKDDRAWAIAKLSGRHAPTQIRLPDKKQLASTFAGKSAAGASDGGDLPFKLPVKVGKTEAVPELVAEKGAPSPRSPLSPAVPLAAAGLGLGLAGFAISRSQGTWSPQDDKPKSADDPVARERFKLQALGVGIAVAVGVGAYFAVDYLPVVIAGLARTAPSVSNILSSESGSVPAAQDAPAEAEGVAANAADGARLAKSLASDAQMSETGTTIAGQGSQTPFRNAPQAAQRYGGDAADWVKKASSHYNAADGADFETHWVENVKTGQRVEFKTKLPDSN